MHLLSQAHQNRNYLPNNHPCKRLEPTRSTTEDIRKEPQRAWQEQWTRGIIKSHTTDLSDPRTGEELQCRGSPTGVKVLNPTSGSPGWGVWHQEEEPPEHWALRQVGLNCRNPTRLRGNRPLLERTPGLTCTGTLGKSSHVIGAWARPTCCSWRVSWGRGEAVAG